MMNVTLQLNKQQDYLLSFTFYRKCNECGARTKQSYAEIILKEEFDPLDCATSLHDLATKIHKLVEHEE